MLVMAPAVDALAHSPTVADAISGIRSGEAREPVGVVAVAPSSELPRMLVVRVGTGWALAPSSLRRELAARWWTSWRRVEPNGIVAVIDDETQASRVSYDRNGRARLKGETALAEPAQR